MYRALALSAITSLVVALTACTTPAAVQPSAAAATSVPAATSAPAGAATQPVTTASPSAAATVGSPAAAPAQLTTVASCYVSYGGTMSPLWFAADGGYFAREGLDVAPQYVGSAAATPALAQGDLQFCQVSGTEVINADLSGLDLVLLAAPFSVFTQQLLGQPSITSVDQLRGKRIGVTTPANADGLTTQYILKKYGLEPGKDYDLVTLRDATAKYAALKQGQIDAELETQPTSNVARQEGFNIVLDLSESQIPFASAGLVSTRHYVDAHPDITRKMVAAYAAAVNDYTSKPDLAKKAIAHFSQMTDQAAIDLTYASHARIMHAPPVPSVDAIATALDMVSIIKPEAASADPNQFIDPSFVPVGASS